MDLFRSVAGPNCSHSLSSETVSLCLFGAAGQERRQYASAPAPQPALSATALLQKAAQMGAAASNMSLLRGLGIMPSTASLMAPEHGAPSAAGLSLELACNGSSSLKELMLGTPSMFIQKHATLDLLGLGVAASGSLTNGFSALMATIAGGLNIAAARRSRGIGHGKKLMPSLLLSIL